MSTRINVAIKLRPLIQREKLEGVSSSWETTENCIFQVTKKTGGDPQWFDHVFNDLSNNKNVFDVVVEPIVSSAVKGINGTVFAYGQTSSGKTHTMKGDKGDVGIIEQTVNHVFELMKSQQDREFLLRASYIEIYNERVNDLLSPSNTNLKVREEDGQVVIQGVTEEVASCAQKVLNLMARGEASRRIAETSMNDRSSRSHTIFRLIIESRESSAGGADDGAIQVSHLNLVDLAGSEKTGQSGSTGSTFKEGCHINMSLTALGKVIADLSEGKDYVNYRDSKLTRILQTSLGGNALTAIICTVTPAVVDQTINTLGFAQRAKKIKNKPIVNEVLSDAVLIKRYARQLAKLRADLSKANAVDIEVMSSQLHEKDALIERLQQRSDMIQKTLINSAVDSGVDEQRARALRRRTWCAPKSGGGPSRMSFAPLPCFGGGFGGGLVTIEEQDSLASGNTSEKKVNLDQTSLSTPTLLDGSGLGFDTPFEDFEQQLIDAAGLEAGYGADGLVSACSSSSPAPDGHGALATNFVTTRRGGAITLTRDWLAAAEVADTPPSTLRQRLTIRQREMDELIEFTTLERTVIADEAVRVEELTAENCSLKERLCSRDAEVERLEKRAAALEVGRAEAEIQLEAAVDKHRRRAEELGASLDEAYQKLEASGEPSSDPTAVGRLAVLEEDNRRLVDVVEEKKKQLASFRKQTEELERAVTNANGRLATLEADNDGALSSLRDVVDKLTAENGNLRAGKTPTDENAVSVEENERLRTELEAMKLKLDQLNTDYETQVTDLRAKLNERGENNLEIITNGESVLRDEIKSLQIEIENLKVSRLGEVEEVKVVENTKLECDIKSLTVELETLKTDYEKQLNERDLKLKQFEDGKLTDDARADLQTEVESLKDRLEQTRSEYEARLTETNSKANKDEVASVQAEEIDRLRAEVEALKSELDDFNSVKVDLANLRTVYEKQLSNRNSELRELEEERLRPLIDENSRLRSEIESFEPDRESLKSLKFDHENLQTIYEKQLAKLNSKSNQDKNVEDLKAENVLLQAELESLRTELDNIKVNYEMQLTDKDSVLNDNESERKDEITQHQTTTIVNNLNNELDVLKTENAKQLADKNSELIKVETEKLNETTQLRTEINLLSQELDALKTESALQSTGNRTRTLYAETETAILRAKIESMNVEMEKLRVALNKQNDDAAASNDRSEETMKSLVEENNGLLIETKTLEAQLDDLRRNYRPLPTNARRNVSGINARQLPNGSRLEELIRSGCIGFSGISDGIETRPECDDSKSEEIPVSSSSIAVAAEIIRSHETNGIELTLPTSTNDSKRTVEEVSSRATKENGVTRDERSEYVLEIEALKLEVTRLMELNGTYEEELETMQTRAVSKIQNLFAELEMDQSAMSTDRSTDSCDVTRNTFGATGYATERSMFFANETQTECVDPLSITNAANDDSKVSMSEFVTSMEMNSLGEKSAATDHDDTPTGNADFRRSEEAVRIDVDRSENADVQLQNQLADSKEQLKSVVEDFTEMALRLNRMEKESSKFQSACAEKSNEIRELGEKIDKFTELLENKTAQLESVSLQLAAMSEENATLMSRQKSDAENRSGETSALAEGMEAMTSSLATSSDESARLEAIVAEKDDEIKTLEGKLEAKSHLVKSAAEFEELTSRFQAFEQEFNKVADADKEKAERIAELLRQSESSSSDNLGTVAELDELKIRYGDSVVEISNLTSRNVELSEKIASLTEEMRSRLEELEKNISELQNNVDSKTRENGDLHDKLSEMSEFIHTSEEYDAVSDSLYSAEKENLELTHVVAELKDKVTTMQAELTSKSELLEESISRVSSLQDQIEKLKDDAGKHDEHLSLLSNNAKERGSRDDNVESLVQEIKSYKTALVREIRALNPSFPANEGLDKELNELVKLLLRTVLEKEKEMILAIQRNFEEGAKRSSDEVDSLNGRLKQKETWVKEIEGDYEKLQGDLAESSAKYDKTNADLRNALQEIKALVEAKESLKEQLSKKESDLITSEIEFSRFKSSLKEGDKVSFGKQRIEELEKLLCDEVSSHEGAKNSIESREGQINILLVRNHELTKEAENAESKMAAETKKCVELESRMESLRHEIETNQESTVKLLLRKFETLVEFQCDRDVDAIVDSVVHHVLTSKTEVGNLENCVLQRNEENLSSKRRVRQLEKRNAEYESQVADLEKRIAGYESQVADLEKAIAEASEARPEVRRLECRVAEYELQVARLEKAVADSSEAASEPSGLRELVAQLEKEAAEAKSLNEHYDKENEQIWLELKTYHAEELEWIEKTERLEKEIAQLKADAERQSAVEPQQSKEASVVPALKERILVLESRVSELTKDKRRADEQLQRSVKVRTTLQDELIAGEHALAAAREKCARLADENREMAAALEVAKAAAATVKTAVVAECECATLRDRVQQLRIDKSDLNGKIARLTLKLQAEDYPHQKEAEESRAELTDLRKKVNDLRSELRRTRMEAQNATVAECSECNRKKAVLHKEVQTIPSPTEFSSCGSGIIREASFHAMREKLALLEEKNKRYKHVGIGRLEYIRQLEAEKENYVPDFKKKY